MNVLITGANGFIGKNLSVFLREIKIENIIPFVRESSLAELGYALEQADVIFHLAGVNRPKDQSEFEKGNVGLTREITDKLIELNKSTPIIMSSSTQAAFDNPYGKSKNDAEIVLQQYAQETGANTCIYRLPNVFGKWSRPNYNSVVATFCNNVINDVSLNIHDRNSVINMIYIDDLCKLLVRHAVDISLETQPLEPIYSTTVGELADILVRFKDSSGGLYIEKVGAGLVRALYSTYLSYLPPKSFAYSVPRHSDARGDFIEMLKTKDSGQISFFTAHPGVTRGGHYHHTKTEKFLVVKGKARYKFRHILTDETHEIVVDGAEAIVVETIPGWSHDITNIGDDELVVMLWANENFDPDNPDTVSYKV